MKITHSIKVLVGLATAWVAIYPLLFFAVWLMMMLSMWGRIPLSGSEFGFPASFGLFAAIFPCHLLTVFIQFGLMAFYLAHVVKNKVGSETIRIILGVGMFFMPFIAMPIYYYAYIWLDEPPAWAMEEQVAG